LEADGYSLSRFESKELNDFNFSDLTQHSTFLPLYSISTSPAWFNSFKMGVGQWCDIVPFAKIADTEADC